MARNKHRMIGVAAGLAMAGLACLPALAESYRLTSGDTLEVNLIGSPDPVSARIDIDGYVRLALIGSVPVAGLTLDEAEERIEEIIIEAGQFVDPQAVVSLADYAPVIVTGDVFAPGRYEYLPNMTVAMALGIAGGQQSVRLNRMDVERARADVEGQLATINLEITGQVVTIARLEAELNDSDTISLSPEAEAEIPFPSTAQIDELLEAERAIMSNNRARAEELLAHWAKEIDILQQQRIVLEQRMTVQESVAASAAVELENARSLQDRGLQTAARMTRVEQQDADARDRLLELQALQITLERGIGDSQRQRTQFIHAKREDVVRALRTEQEALSDSKLRYTRALEQRSILSGGDVTKLMEVDNFTLTFRIVSPHEGRSRSEEVTADTVIWPGETLMVSGEFKPVDG